MKNLFKTSLYLFAFAFAGIMFQIACSNSDETRQAQTQTGKLIYYKLSNTGFDGIWTCNYDGTDDAQVPIVLPTNTYFSGMNSNSASLKISPDGQKIFFIASNTSGEISIYSCDIDGSNLQPIINTIYPNALELGGVN